MQFAFSDEQSQFRDTVARFCRDKAPPLTVRKLSESTSGFDPAVWKQAAVELGLIAIHVAEARGGGGFGAVELGIVMEEFGRSLMPLPYLSSVLASTVLSQAGDDGAELLATLANGGAVVTLALEEHHGDPVSNAVRVTKGARLHGTVRAVLDAHVADHVLVIARDERRTRLFTVAAGTPGMTTTPLRTLDGTRRLARLAFEDCAAVDLGPLDDDQVTRIYDTALVALANELAGGARALLDSTLEYTRLRVQFGRPIGSFQAIKHRLADLHTDVELARVAAWQAAQALVSDEQPSANASLAKFVTSDACMHAAREAIQLRGGIGFTWENDTHLWYRRAKSSEVFLGTPAFHRERMLKEMAA